MRIQEIKGTKTKLIIKLNCITLTENQLSPPNVPSCQFPTPKERNGNCIKLNIPAIRKQIPVRIPKFLNPNTLAIKAKKYVFTDVRKIPLTIRASFNTATNIHKIRGGIDRDNKKT